MFTLSRKYGAYHVWYTKGTLLPEYSIHETLQSAFNKINELYNA